MLISTNRRESPRREEPANRVNEQITGVQQVRLVGENITLGVYTIGEALRIAEAQGLDLIEIAYQETPVCRVADYAKFLYDQKKKQKEMKAKVVKSLLKEIRFGPNTDDHDFDFKVKHARKFLEEGSKVKAYVHFRGRAIVYAERGRELLNKFADALADLGKIEKEPALEGKRMFIYINPKGKKDK